jgi:ubiquinone biosynthesis protein UbiJ
MARYFLSYARADAQAALQLADDLRVAGVDLWIDQRDILPSQRWDRAVESALRGCTAVVVLLTPRSVASENVLDEIGFAVDHRKDVIPMLFEVCDVPMRINRLQRIDFTGDYAAALERCKAVLVAEPRPVQAVRAFDPDTVQRAEEALTAYLGPIAAPLVAAAAARTHNAAELYRELAARIPDPNDRAAFLRRVPAHSGLQPAFVFSRPVLEAVILELAKFLGPIARRVVEQVARDAKDVDDLYEGVASRVTDEDDRATLLERLRALG